MVVILPDHGEFEETHTDTCVQIMVHGLSETIQTKSSTLEMNFCFSKISCTQRHDFPAFPSALFSYCWRHHESFEILLTEDPIYFPDLAVLRVLTLDVKLILDGAARPMKLQDAARPGQVPILLTGCWGSGVMLL